MENINPDDIHYPVTKLVALENTVNRGGGRCYPIEEIKKIATYCKAEKMPLHLDGARLFNALVKTQIKADKMGSMFDSISLCFSKGMGAPVGSVLIGSKEFIYKARRVRKVLGGGMRQAGILANAGIFALKNNIDRLSIDHTHAKIIEQALIKCSWIKNVLEVETNIVVAYLKDRFLASDFIEKLARNGILVIPFGKGRIRMVTHLDISESDVAKVVESLKF